MTPKPWSHIKKRILTRCNVNAKNQMRNRATHCAATLQAGNTHVRCVNYGLRTPRKPILHIFVRFQRILQILKKNQEKFSKKFKNEMRNHRRGR